MDIVTETFLKNKKLWIKKMKLGKNLKKDCKFESNNLEMNLENVKKKNPEDQKNAKINKNDQLVRAAVLIFHIFAFLNIHFQSFQIKCMFYFKFRVFFFFWKLETFFSNFHFFLQFFIFQAFSLFFHSFGPHTFHCILKTAKPWGVFYSKIHLGLKCFIRAAQRELNNIATRICHRERRVIEELYGWRWFQSWWRKWAKACCEHQDLFHSHSSLGFCNWKTWIHK